MVFSGTLIYRQFANTSGKIKLILLNFSVLVLICSDKLLRCKTILFYFVKSYSFERYKL